jgi:hypothetical protein
LDQEGGNSYPKSFNPLKNALVNLFQLAESSVLN